MIKEISPKRQALIDAKNKSELTIGEKIWVRYNALQSYFDKERDNQTIYCVILSINKDKIKVRYADNSVYKNVYEITEKDIVGRDIYLLGANPFDIKFENIRPVAFTLESILFNLNIFGEKSFGGSYEIGGHKLIELNWNPYVYNKKGEKEHYQRDFVWKLKDKQLLIDSIYAGIDCGKILVRKRDWKELEKMAENGETELSFNDLVDGKQRLHTLKEFLEGKFLDSNGNCYGDLSFDSQRRLTNNQLFSYAEMPGNSKDEDVIHQFLKLNFSGVPQSKEHIDFVKEISKKL